MQQLQKYDMYFLECPNRICNIIDFIKSMVDTYNAIHTHIVIPNLPSQGVANSKMHGGDNILTPCTHLHVYFFDILILLF